jgi:hypothetical protein
MNRIGASLTFGAAIALGVAESAKAFTINPTFASSITGLSNAAQWESALNYAIGQFETDFTNPITINITFQGNPGTGIFGRSSANGVIVGGYSNVKSILTANAQSPNALVSVAHLPASDPTSGGTFQLMDAQAQALGQLPANYSGTDGTVTIGEGYSWTFDPSNRAVSGKSDFIGVAEHEISEVMGRYGDANLGGGTYGPLDLFGYAFSGGPGTGVLNLAMNQSNNYFCIDGGQTPLKLYNNHSNGEDDKDWGSGSNDAFNAFSNSGVVNDMSAIDVEEMNVIGYQVPLPEPASLGLAGIGVFGLTRRGRSSIRLAQVDKS